MKREKLTLIIDNKPVSFQDISKDYMHNIFEDYSTNAINQLSRLTHAERTLLILYAELNSLQKIAEIYNCSKVTIWSHIQKIRTKIKTHIKHD